VLADKLCGAVPWSATLENYGHDRFVSASDYVRFYQAQHSETLSYLAAGASACGIALETAIRQVNTAVVDLVRDALLHLDRPTFFGYLKFELKGMNSNGPVLIVQLDGSGAGAERILAPDDRAVSSARLRWPFDQ